MADTGSVVDVKPVDVKVIDAPPPDAKPDAMVVVIDAAKPDMALPPVDAVAPPPVDAAPDAPPPIDACVSDPACGGSAGTHCTATGEILTCSAVVTGCFHVTTAAQACPSANQSCPSGQNACVCTPDPLCASGPGKYCDAAGTGTYTCAVGSDECDIHGADSACTAPEVCQPDGSLTAVGCACPAVGTHLGETCNSSEPPVLCDSTTGNIIKCVEAGGCSVWQLDTDCASSGLTCNNSGAACVCPQNLTDNFWADPNVDRTKAPARFAGPNGFLLGHGFEEICTYPSLSQALTAAATDVVLRGANPARAVATASGSNGDGVHAVFTAETFPLIVGYDTDLTTTHDADPSVGGDGTDHPEDFTISFNSSTSASRFFNTSGTAIILDPLLASAQSQSQTEPAGGTSTFRGFTVSATQANINCPLIPEGSSEPAAAPGNCTPTIGGAAIAVASVGGHVVLENLAVFGQASDNTAARKIADANVPSLFPGQNQTFADVVGEFGTDNRLFIGYLFMDVAGLEGLDFDDFYNTDPCEDSFADLLDEAFGDTGQTAGSGLNASYATCIENGLFDSIENFWTYYFDGPDTQNPYNASLLFDAEGFDSEVQPNNAAGRNYKRRAHMKKHIARKAQLQNLAHNSARKIGAPGGGGSSGTDGPFGETNSLLAKGFGNIADTNFALQFFGAGEVVATLNQGFDATGAQRMLTGNHADYEDNVENAVELAGYRVFSDDPSSQVPNLVAADAGSGKSAVGLLVNDLTATITADHSGEIEGDTGEIGNFGWYHPIDRVCSPGVHFTSTGLHIQNIDGAGAWIDTTWFNGGTGDDLFDDFASSREDSDVTCSEGLIVEQNNSAPHQSGTIAPSASSVTSNGGEITATVDVNSDLGDGIEVVAGGVAVDGAGPAADDVNGDDPTFNDAIYGGVTTNNLKIDNSARFGEWVNNWGTDCGNAGPDESGLIGNDEDLGDLSTASFINAAPFDTYTFCGFTSAPASSFNDISYGLGAGGEGTAFGGEGDSKALITDGNGPIAEGVGSFLVNNTLDDSISGSDGIRAERTEKNGAQIRVALNGGSVHNNGTLGDLTPALSNFSETNLPLPTAALLESFGNGVALYGASFTSSNATITNNVLSGIDEEDAVFYSTQDTFLTNNEQDVDCAGDIHGFAFDAPFCDYVGSPVLITGDGSLEGDAVYFHGQDIGLGDGHLVERPGHLCG